MKSVLLSGYYGFGNLGDELILKNTAALFREMGFTSIYAVSGDIEYSRSKHPDIEFIDRNNYSAMVNAVRRVDLVALGGGGLFQDYNRLETAGLFESPKMGVHSYINVPLIAHIYTKPIAYLFQGVGPLFSEDSRNFTRYAYSLSNYISVRDRESVSLLEELGIQDVILSSDPCFLFPVERVKTGKERPRVAISLRQWVDKAPEEKIVKAISDFLNILPLEYDPYFISFQDHDEGNTDSSIYRRIEADLKEGRVLNLIRSKDHSLEEVERIISGFDFVIGMRLHSIILAIKYGIPFLAIPYWNKVESLLNETELGDLSIPMNELCGEKIRERFLSIISESIDLKKKIEKGRSVVEERLKLDIDHFKDFVKGIAEVKTFPVPVGKPDEISPLPPDWINYKSYQERLKRQFYSKRYSPFQIRRILNRSNFKKIIFYPSPILWDVPLFQRPHQIFKELSKRGYLIFFLSPDPKADRAEPIREINENLYLIKDIDMLYCLKDEPILLWITWTPNIVCKELFPKSTVVYDWIDELDVFGYYSKFMEIDHRKLLHGADIVFATSDSLLEEAKTLRPGALLVPNGVCIEDFRVKEDVIPEDMASILANGKPVIGFYGLLADWRVDYDLVNYLCSECKDLNFVLIGPSYDGSSKRLRPAENLFLLGPKKYEELKYYLKHFDVAMIPYKVDRITNSVFPVKLCEYMAGGKPVVTTNMKECRKFKSVLVSEDGEDFIKNMRKALLLKDDVDYLKVLKEEANSNTWEQRADKIISGLESERLPKLADKERIEERLSIVVEEVEATQKLLNHSLYETERLNSKLKHIMEEKDHLWNQLNQTITEKNALTSQLNQTTIERDSFSSQLTQVSSERDNTSRILSGIYGSNFWKVASLYYKVRDHTPIIRGMFKTTNVLRRERSKGFIKRLRKKVKSEVTTPLSDGGGISYPNKYDLIFFSIINWDFRFQRPQQIATRFSKNGHRVFYLSADLKKQSSYTKRKVRENVFEITLPFKDNVAIYNTDLREGIEMLTNCMRALFGDFRIKESVAFVEFPLWNPLVKHLKDEYGTKVVFDCLDEFTGFGNVTAETGQIEEILLKSTDFCITTSMKLYEKLKDRCENVEIVRNGTEFEHFNNLPANNTLKDLKKPIIGYYGAIAEWFDTDTVEHVAVQRPEWNIVLIGHTFGSDIERLKKYKNVYILGEKPYTELPKYLYWFDVCIIPFKINKLTLSTNPVKFYEFISSGKPVVSSKLPELLPYAEFLYLSEGKEEFLKSIEVGLKENDEDLISKRIELAKANDWNNRFNDIQNYIKSTFPLVSIILVTYDNLDYTKQCLESIFAKTAYPNYEVIVVDNGSKDGTWSYLLNLRENHANLKIILNDENLGFAKANNMGIKESKGKYIIFLNNDTIITRGLIKGIVRYLEDKEVGMVGPVTNSIFNEAKVEVTYSTPDGLEDFAEQYTLAHGGESFEIKTLALYCAGIRREVMDDVGMLDERYKVGMFEDDDYSLRLRHRGYKVLCARDLFVHHYGMASFSKLKNEEYLKIFIENKKRFEEKWAVNWEPHIHNAREEEEKVRDHNNFQKGIALTKVSIKKYVPDKIKRILRPYYKRYVVNDNAESTGKNEANYRVYQERLKIQFKKNRYEGFMKKFLQDKHYEDIIFYPSLVDWDIPLFQRPHQIFRELSRRGYLVFFLTPNPRGDHVNPIRRINDNLYLVKDIDMLYDLKEKPLILWISWTPNIVCEEFLQKSRVVYDYMDELEVFAYHCKLMEVDHKKLIQTSDIVITSASNLYLEVQETRRDVILMPNGVCVEDFRPGEDKVPKDLKPIIDKGRPIIGYYGALAKWLDYDLVNFACKQCKDLSFVFIGPELDGSFKRFRSSNNLFLLGAKRYEELKYYLKHFDVATIPFKIDKIAHSTSPVKLFEYMAGEKPIVTTEMKECKKYRSVLISKDRREYILNIRKALMLRYDSDYTSTLKREASVNTWSSRIDVIIKHLQKKN